MRPRSGALHLSKLIEALGGASAVAAAKTRDLTRFGLSDATVAAISNPDEVQIESDLQWLSQPNHHLLCWDDDAYPVLLRRISNPPAALFIDGDPGCLWQPQIAVIGSRNPTAGGLDHARDFAATLARQGMTITSGLASGIDTAAHQGGAGCGCIDHCGQRHRSGSGLSPAAVVRLPSVSVHRAQWFRNYHWAQHQDASISRHATESFQV